MKRLFPFSLWVFLLTLNFSCAQKPQTDHDFLTALNKVTVGMTYEEVESLLGKPHEIDRGITVYQREAPAVRDIFPDSIRNDPRFVIAAPKEQSFGQLMYVSWMYLLGGREDTLFVPHVEYYRDGSKKIAKQYYAATYYQFVIFESASGRVTRKELLCRYFLPL